MVPHGIFPAAEDDSWVAIACRDDSDWERLADASSTKTGPEADDCNRSTDAWPQ